MSSPTARPIARPRANQSSGQGGDARRQGSEPVPDLGRSVGGAERQRRPATRSRRSRSPATRRSTRPARAATSSRTLCMKCHGENFFPMRPRSAAGLEVRPRQHDGQEPARERTSSASARACSPAREQLPLRRPGPQGRARVPDEELRPRQEAARGQDRQGDAARRGGARQGAVHRVLRRGGRERGRGAAPSASPRPIRKAPRAAWPASAIIMQVTIDAAGQPLGGRSRRAQPARAGSIRARGEQKAWTLPDKRAGVHDMSHGPAGQVWVLEFARTEDGKVDGSGAGSELHSRLLGFNPKTEKWEHRSSTSIRTT